jgi:SAM-dependent methyltransferase
MDDTTLEQFRERQRRVWALGDYAKIAEIILPVSRALVDACAISAGQEVLDVAAGSGNLALLAAEEGASVVASDISPAQIELGRARTQAEGVDVEWVEADVENLPFEDERFDCCASVFGAMFAPRPEVAAGEMFRVVRPGGTVGLAVWGDFGFQGRMFGNASKYAPPLPEGMPSPRDWGNEEIARQRLEGLASHVQLERRTVRWEFESAEVMWNVFSSAGPQVATREMLDDDKLQQLAAESAEIVREHDQGDGTRIVLEPEYLQIVARKRG